MTNPKYAASHQRLRRALLPSAVGSACVRCGLVILPGQPIDLDHQDDGVNYRGWSHSFCNRSAAGRRGRQVQLARKKRRAMLTRCSLGIQISDDRRHTSIAAAGFIDDGVVLVELAAYLDGTDPVEAVLKLKDERKLGQVAIDPHSPAATAIKPLVAARVRVVELSTHDVAVAYGQFLDELNAGRLKAASSPLLSAAVQHGTSRALGGAATWQRRGTAVDTAPLDAATFAVWSVLNKSAVPAIY
jgi:hypothetical protein